MAAELAKANSARRSLIGELWRFLIVGSTNAAIDFFVYFLLTRALAYWAEHYLQANALAFLIANLNSFIWNRFWTFTVRHGNPLRQYAEFLGVSIVYLGFIQLGLWLLVSRLGIFDLLAKVIVIGLGMLIYFGVLRHIVFWRSSRTKAVV
jgi:putative flippase GtrA